MYIYIFIYISEKHQMLNSTKAHVFSADHVCLTGKTGFNSNSLTTTNRRMTPLLLRRLLPGPDRSRATEPGANLPHQGGGARLGCCSVSMRKSINGASKAMGGMKQARADYEG